MATGVKAATRKKSLTRTHKLKVMGHKSNVPTLDWKGSHKSKKHGKKRHHKR